MKKLIIIMFLILFSVTTQAADLMDQTELAVAPDESADYLYIVDGGLLDKRISPLSLMLLLETSMTSFAIHNDNLDVDLTTLGAPTAWRTFYSNGTSVVTELAFGAQYTLLRSEGASAAPTFTLIDHNSLEASNSPTDEYFLTYELDTDNFQWVAAPGGGDITTVGLCTTADCTADFIDATDMADDDYGDFTISGGLATLDGDVVDSAEIADDAVDSEHYAANSIDNEHMSDNSIDSDDYVDASIDAAHLAADIIDETKIANDGIDSEHYNDASIDKVHLAGDIIDGTKIDDDVLDSEHYVAASIDNEHLADDAVDSDELAAGSVDVAHMSVNSIDSDQYVDGSIDEPHLNSTNAGTDNYLLSYNAAGTNFTWIPATAGGTVTTLLSETVQQGGADIVSVDFDAPFTVAEAPDTYITIDVADDGIDSQHYAATSVDQEHMAANSVDSDQYVDGSIDLIHMSVNSIDSDQYVDGSIDTAHIAADQIDATLIADDAVDSEHYTANSIDAEHMSDNSIDSDDYVDGSIDEAHLNIANGPTDEYVLSYETDTTNFQWVAMTTGGTLKTIQEGDSNVAGSGDDIVTLDFDATVFGMTESPDTEINIDIADDGLDSQHYAAGSIDTEHIAADQIDATLIADDAIDSEHYTDASIDEPHLFASNDPVDNYILSYNAIGGNFTWVVDAGGANLGIYDGGVQVGDTDIDKIDLDGTVFAVTEPVDTDILIDIADDGIDSAHYIADSIDNEHINWADITNLDNDGVLVSLGGNVAVGAHELQSTGNIVLQLGDAAGTNVFEIEDSGSIEVFQVDSDGTINSSTNPSIAGYDSDWNENTWKISDGTNEDADDGEMLLQVKVASTDTTFIELDGINETVEAKYPLTAPSVDGGIPYVNVEADNGTYQIDESVCRVNYYIIDATGPPDTLTIEMPPDTECATNSIKKLCFNIAAASIGEITWDPDTGDNLDKFKLPMSSSSGAGVSIDLAGDADNNEGFCVEGRTSLGTDYWIVTSVQGDAPVE